MSVLQVVPAPDPPPSWLERVRAELRPEFAGALILAAAGGPALVGPACAVPECARAAVAHRLCHAHVKGWDAAGRPPLERWAPSAPARRKGVRPLRPCQVPGCRRGRAEAGLCNAHRWRWNRDGRPEIASWSANAAGPPLAPLPTCPVPGCVLAGEGSQKLCESHTARWRNHGKPPLAQFLRDLETCGQDRFDLRHLPPLMRAEIAYAIQRRADERRTQTRPDLLRRLITRLPAGAESLRQRSAAEWHQQLGWRNHKSTAARFLIDALGWLEDLAVGVGWESEFDRDVWQLRRLGYPTRNMCLRFDAIAAPWLRQLAKRWARWRLSTGITPSSVATGLLAVRRLAERFPELARGPGALTRALLESHLVWLAERYPNAKGRTAHISAIAGLIRTARQHGWEPRLPASVEIYREDYPRTAEPTPRALSEVVMAQLEAPANLERLADPQARLLAQILMGTGLRVGDGCRLALDCLAQDQHGAPYLRYRNHKMRRDALVPIDARLAGAIAERQRLVRARFPDAAHLLMREKRNPDGLLHFSPDTFRHRLARWLADCEVRDELGRPAVLTPHQWRHTYATRLINADVPQEVVRRLLDHSTHHMTARYARLSQQTIRAKWEAARKVDVNGRTLEPTEGPLAEAEWMKNNLARAKMALPNGFCALPLKQRCEYANACLTCPMFVTTAEFLPEHRRQLEATRALIARGEAAGQARLVEMNRTVERNLHAIIDALEGDDARRADCDGAQALEDRDAG